MPYFEAILCKNREMSLSLFLPQSYLQAILSLGILINSILIRKKRCSLVNEVTSFIWIRLAMGITTLT